MPSFAKNFRLFSWRLAHESLASLHGFAKHSVYVSELACFPPLSLSLHLVVSFIYSVCLCHPEPAEVTETQSSDGCEAAIFGWHFPVHLLLSRMTQQSLCNCPAFLRPRQMLRAWGTASGCPPPRRCCPTTVLDPGFKLHPFSTSTGEKCLLFLCHPLYQWHPSCFKSCLLSFANHLQGCLGVQTPATLTSGSVETSWTSPRADSQREDPTENEAHSLPIALVSDSVSWWFTE